MCYMRTKPCMIQDTTYLKRPTEDMRIWLTIKKGNEEPDTDTHTDEAFRLMHIFNLNIIEHT